MERWEDFASMKIMANNDKIFIGSIRTKESRVGWANFFGWAVPTRDILCRLYQF